MDDVLRLQARMARAEVESGRLRGRALRDLLLSIPLFDRDGFTDTLLGIEEPPPDLPDLPRGCVPYLPCGVEEILAAVLETPVEPDDHVVDLGSGLGRAAILIHLLSGARASGVEIQEPLVRRARARCAELGLASVSFVHADAADADLDGSLFFLYGPFNGPTLARVMLQLADVARRRAIVLCAVAIEFRDVPWLLPRATSSVALTLYDSSVPGVPPRTSRRRGSPSPMA